MNVMNKKKAPTASSNAGATGRGGAADPVGLLLAAVIAFSCRDQGTHVRRCQKLPKTRLVRATKLSQRARAWADATA
jgi:hypothetical protein